MVDDSDHQYSQLSPCCTYSRFIQMKISGCSAILSMIGWAIMATGPRILLWSHWSGAIMRSGATPRGISATGSYWRRHMMVIPRGVQWYILALRGGPSREGWSDPWKDTGRVSPLRLSSRSVVGSVSSWIGVLSTARSYATGPRGASPRKTGGHCHWMIF